MGQPGPDKSGSPPAEHIGWVEVSGGSETSQYPEEKKLFPEQWRTEGEEPKPYKLNGSEPMLMRCCKAGNAEPEQAKELQTKPQLKVPGKDNHRR